MQKRQEMRLQENLEKLALTQNCKVMILVIVIKTLILSSLVNLVKMKNNLMGQILMKRKNHSKMKVAVISEIKAILSRLINKL